MKFRFLLSISLLKTIYFNFKFFRYKEAIKFPVILARGVIFKKLDAKIVIKQESLRKGSIQIGFLKNGFQTKQNRTILEFKGGEIQLGCDICISKGVLLSVGKYGKLIINNNIVMGGNSRLLCFEHVNIGENTRIGWDVTIIDTDFHETINIQTKQRKIAKKPIIIGQNNWIGFGATLKKGTETPNFCIVGSQAVLSKKYQFDDYCTLAGNPAKKIMEGFYRDLDSYVS